MSLKFFQNRHLKKLEEANQRKDDFLYSLQKTTTEEEVKFLYIRELNLKVDMSNKNDLIIGSCLFEFKYNKQMSNKEQLAKVAAQSLYYVKRHFDKEKEIKHVVICDKDESLILEVVDFEYFYTSKKYKWDARASSPDKNLIKDIATSNILETYEVFNITKPEELTVFKTNLLFILTSP